jgi:hypothetical protein
MSCRPRRGSTHLWVLPQELNQILIEKITEKSPCAFVSTDTALQVDFLPLGDVIHDDSRECLPGFLWCHPAGRYKGTSFPWGQDGSLNSLWCFHWHHREVGWRLIQPRVDSWLYLAFCDTTLAWRGSFGYLFTAWWEWKSRLSAQSLIVGLE